MARSDVDYPEVGSAAPAFALPASGGQTIKLSAYKGKSVVVLFFYPKDMTSGCTKEACGFRDAHAGLKKAGVTVLGISPDPVRQHEKFVEKHALNYPLLADEDHAVAEAYGVWREKSLYGREYMGIVRTTFVIDRKGKIAHVFANVKANGHAEEVRAWLDENMA
ncbi:MAG TPA: thioredoxin-dependent thiol peroxidase [Phycisphaerae bacterium]|nr:thioredoxin-dependent thiol peroxidase [Phycisphaerales bacterium]HRX86464.1 thioredoxin-dependent thiol peroxidase [Phycisphaerae bacterium]